MKTVRMSQKEKLLALLRQAGPQGVNSFGIARDLALQLPVRIKELKEAGYFITTRQRSNRSVDYILIPSSTDPATAPTMSVEAPKPIQADLYTPQSGQVTYKTKQQKLRDIEEKLADLRIAYKHSALTKRDIFLRQARALIISREKIERKGEYA